MSSPQPQPIDDIAGVRAVPWDDSAPRAVQVSIQYTVEVSASVAFGSPFHLQFSFLFFPFLSFPSSFGTNVGAEPFRMGGPDRWILGLHRMARAIVAQEMGLAPN